MKELKEKRSKEKLKKIKKKKRFLPPKVSTQCSLAVRPKRPHDFESYGTLHIFEF